MPSNLSDTDLLARLVAFDTTSHKSNLEIADWVAEHLDRPGVTIARHPSPDGTKANLLVRVGPSAGEASRDGLVLSGHMDVVPALEAGWTSDPFSLTERGDRLAARGSADMKGFLALATALARDLEPQRLAAPLVLLFTYDEEVGTLGAHHLVEEWEGSAAADAIGPLPRATVIGEPTELRPVRLHKGHLKLRFELTGVSAHSGYPHLGVNAIEAAGRAITALAALRRELEGERVAASRHFPEVPFAALNVGTIAGGAAINVVPDRCVVEVGARVLPGMDSGELARRIRETVVAAVGEAAVAGEGGGEGQGQEVPPEVPVAADLLSDSPPLESPADAPLHRHLCSTLGQPCGADGEPERGVSFATDAGWLSHLGLDCVIFGPGSIEVAHKPDESIPKGDLVAARRHLEGLIQRFCVEGGQP